MTKCLLMPECASSLLPVVPVCRELGLGFEVDQGGEAGRFHRDGETVVELVVDGELLVVPEDLECMLCVGTVALHAELVLGLEHSQSGEPAWMKQHQLDGHPYDKRCPWCVQGRLKQRQHFRQLPGSGESLSGSRRVQLDFTGPYEPGVTGSKVALVGVETEDDWGYVGLQQDRSAQSTLVSIQDLEVEFTVDSNGRAGSIGHIHHDDDKSFRGVVERYIRSRGWRDTHTGGYNPNANAKAEVRIGMLKQLFRVALLCATGGQAYYPQLWDVGLKYCNRVINRRKWSDRESPLSRLTGLPVPKDKHTHSFCSYCLFHIPKPNRDGAFRPPSEMGVWVGLDQHVEGGHWVCPIQWDSDLDCWLIGDVVTATTVRVYDTVFPLRMKAPPGADSSDFDSFVNRVFHPLLSEPEVPEPDVIEPDAVEPDTVVPGAVVTDAIDPDSVAPSVDVPDKVNEPDSVEPVLDSDYSSGSDTECEVESIVNTRMHKGRRQYKLKWKGYDNRYNSWKDESDLHCSDLVEQYVLAHLGLSKQQVLRQVLAIALCFAAAGSVVQPVLAVVLPDLDVARAVKALMAKQGLSGAAVEFHAGYETELVHMLGRRLELLSEDEAERVRCSHPVVSMRMILEAKKDGRKKARLVLQGFKEPREWDLDSNASPVAFTSTIRSLVFMQGEPDDVLSSIDVSVAFLQSDLYSPDDKPRYVSYKPYSGSVDYVMKLRGPVYRQRSAGRAWFNTLTHWLKHEMGYVPGLNEPCAFLHPVTGHRIVLFCDDFLCRGSRVESDRFYTALMNRFDCKDPTYLEVGSTLTFTGLDISLKLVEGKTVVRVDQERDMLNFLEYKGLGNERVSKSPMPDRKELLDPTEISENLQSWCKSVIGGLHYFARGTRWDIAQSVSRVAQTMAKPTAGTVIAIERIAGYLKGSSDFALETEWNSGGNSLVSMCDSNHHGDSGLTTVSQTGVIVLLNGVPVHWRSNTQPKTTLSPAESEVYALSVGVKDVRLHGWVLQELGVCVDWPMSLHTDSTGAVSFKNDTCPTSKLRGCFDYRAKWVQELRSAGEIDILKTTDALNLADIFTKCMSNSKFKSRVDQIQAEAK